MPATIHATEKALFKIFSNDFAFSIPAYLTFHGIWKTPLPFLSPARREALISPPSLVGKGAGGLGFALAFPHDVKSQTSLSASLCVDKRASG